MRLPVIEIAWKIPEFPRSGNRRQAALQRKNQVLGVQFQFLQPHFFELFIFSEVRLPKQFFQPLSVAMMFGMQAVNLFAQRLILDFVHQAPPCVN